MCDERNYDYMEVRECRQPSPWKLLVLTKDGGNAIRCIVEMKAGDADVQQFRSRHSKLETRGSLTG